MRKPRIGLTLVLLAAVACALSLPDRAALALKAGAGADDTTSGPCMEMFHECLRGCGPPGSNLGCQKYCEEQVLARCKAGAAVKGRAVSPGAAKGTVKSPSQ